MIKKLKIRFVKLEDALVVQQLEMTGKELFTPSGHVALWGFGIDFSDEVIRLSRSCDINIGIRRFNHNAERDEYLNKVIKWISEEQFAENGKLEVGKLCDVSDDNKDWRRRTLLAVLPKSYFTKYIASENYSDFKWCSWKYARPLASCVCPKIDGDVYTWEMEVAE